LSAIQPSGRTLIVRPGAIGDFIVSLPALESIPGRFREVWCAGPNVPLARFANAAYSIASSGLDLLGLPGVDPPPRLIERLRAFDAVYSWYGTGRPEFREAVRHLPFRFFPALPAAAAGQHACDFYWRQLGNTGVCPPPRIDCRLPTRENFVAIHPFAASPAKRWPLENFRALARLLPAPVYFCAGPEDALDDAVRYENLYDLACWIARARLYIGNDSGISHLAAAAGVPTVALFGPTDPAIWAPRGPRVTVLRGLPDLNPQQAARTVTALPTIFSQ
jgi:lipopolysaccharide heptosyltransferase III